MHKILKLNPNPDPLKSAPARWLRQTSNVRNWINYMHGVIYFIEKWIRQTIQSANCAPARRLKRRNKCVLPNSEIILKCETNRWKLVHFLHTKIIPALMVIEADSVWWEPYTLTHTLLCTLIHTLLCVDSVRVSHTLLCVDSVREIQFNIQISSKVSWSNRFK